MIPLDMVIARWKGSADVEGQMDVIQLARYDQMLAGIVAKMKATHGIDLTGRRDAEMVLRLLDVVRQIANEIVATNVPRENGLVSGIVFLADASRRTLEM